MVIKADIQPVANALSSLDIYIEVDLGFMAVFLSSVGGTAPLCPLEMFAKSIFHFSAPVI